MFASHFPSDEVQNEAEIRGSFLEKEKGPEKREGLELEDQQVEKKAKQRELDLRS